MKSLALILSILFASLLFVETEVKAEDIDLEDSDDDGIPDDEEGVNICLNPARYFKLTPNSFTDYLSTIHLLTYSPPLPTSG